MKKIVLASKNLDKVKEMRLALKILPVEILSLADFAEIPDAIEDGATFEDINIRPAGIDYVFVGGKLSVDGGEIASEQNGSFMPYREK